MSRWGPLVTPLDVEAAVKTILQTWIDSALTEIERRTPGWGIRELPRPQSWEVVTDIDEIQDWPDRDLPAVIVESAGEAVDPQLGPSGQVNGEVALTITTAYRGSTKHVNRARTREIVILLATAVRWVLLKHGDLDGIADGVVIGVTDYDIAAPAKPRTLSGAETELIVVLSNVANRFGLPAEPDEPAPTDPPPTSPEWAAHTATHVTVTHKETT